MVEHGRGVGAASEEVEEGFAGEEAGVEWCLEEALPCLVLATAARGCHLCGATWCYTKNWSGVAAASTWSGSEGVAAGQGNDEPWWWGEEGVGAVVFRGSD